MKFLASPLDRAAFFRAGALLMLAKVALDSLVAQLFDKPFGLSFYILQSTSVFVHAPASEGVGSPPDTAYWLSVVGCALPFVAVGLALTLRRLRDAGLPGLLVLFFFVPILKFLFFVGLTIVPTKRPVGETFDPHAGPFRGEVVALPPEERVARRRPMASLLGVLAGTAVGLVAMGISVGFLRSYGWPLMMASPALAGFVATTVYCKLCRPTPMGASLVTLATFVLGMIALAASAVEGFGCIVMGAPLFFGEALLGTLLAYGFAKANEPLRLAGSAVLMLPLAFAARSASPPPAEDALVVESEVVVHAPADVVWKRVIAFPPLDPPSELIFRAGIAAPLAATIDGEGVGAVRRCQFTTGDFVEPIDVWRPGRELSFHVASQPDPMRELTLYPGPRPPHLDGYLESVKGQFVLEPQADGSTRLAGRTWYRTHMEPARYWRLWGDAILHRIHLRVLDHVAKLAEPDARATGG